MKLAKPPRAYVLGFWFSMPFITFALCYILYGGRMFREWQIPAVTFPIIYFIGYFSWRAHSLYDLWLRKKFPSLEETKKRVFYKLASNLMVMTPSVLIIFYVFHFLQIFGYRVTRVDLLYGYLVGLCVNIIFETLWEVLYLVDKYKESAYEKQLLERMQLLQEFENLKQRVNPHFLFNCFNTLLALIGENRQQAEIFLDELSKVYRYLLRNNETNMSTLQQEVGFIQSYARLLKTRYGNGFDLNIKIDSSLGVYELPSLTLQLLVENVIKHNIVSKQKPLHISILATADARLVVENTLAKRLKKAESSGIGLSNIKDKYRLLNRSDVFIEETSERFTVSLPLLKPEAEHKVLLANRMK